MTKPDDPLLVECHARERDDIGNGERFRLRYGDLAEASEQVAIRVAHVGWHIFDGTRFAEDEDERLVRPLAHKTARAIRHEMALIKPTETEQEELDQALAAGDMLARMGAWESGWTTEKKTEYQAGKAMIAAGERATASLKDRRAALVRHAKASAGKTKLDAMLHEAGPYVSLSVDGLNCDRMRINCRSGVLHFDQVRPPGDDKPALWQVVVEPHTPLQRITKLLPQPLNFDGDGGLAEFDPIADCPEFTRFMEKVQPSGEMRDFLQRTCGLCLTGLISEQCLWFFLGAGRNGKSTFLDIIAHVMGDYAVAMSIDTFSGDSRRSGAEATPDLARLPGARLVAASEPEEGVHLKEALIKMLTGGEKFPVRRLNKDFFEIDPQFKLILAGNHKPVIKGSDDGIWRRIHLVPWDVQIAEKDVDRALPEKLRGEAAGIFRWMLEGALDYLSFGLQPPDAVRGATAEYRQESDPVGSFIRNACHVSGRSDDEVTPHQLHEAYMRWCKAEGQFDFKPAAFAKRFAEASRRPWPGEDGKMLEFKKIKSQGRSVYQGIHIDLQWTMSLPRDGDGDDR